MFTKAAVSVEDPCSRKVMTMTSLVLKESVGEEMSAEAAGSVYESEVLDTGQEDPSSQKEATSEDTVTVSEYSMPTETVDMLIEQSDPEFSANITIAVSGLHENTAIEQLEEWL